MAAAAPHPWTGFATGTALVAVTYAFFLLFAQFAFVQLVRDITPESFMPIMAAQGVGGLAGSFLAAWLFRAERTRPLLIVAFLLGSSVAAASPSASGPVALGGLAAVTGLAIGTFTVVVATSLRDLVGPARLGWACGLGTGLAYAFCSWPAIFLAAPDRQALLAAGLALGGAALATLAPSSRPAATPGPGLAARSLAGWLIILFGLVAFDSGAFMLIQQDPTLQAAAWSGKPRQYGVAAAHLLAALVAGALLSRGRAGVAVAVATVLLAAGCGLLAAGGRGTAVVYAAGVSLYSAALVHLPARFGQARLTALTYGLCGWTASALGLALASRWLPPP